MLEELELTDLGPIPHATIQPSAGMTAITGETGAGKSMLLNAVKLICGGQADSSRVHPGSIRAWAQGIFVANDGAAAWQAAKEAGVEDDDGELYLSRTVPAQGRSRAVLNGKTVPRTVLARISEDLITVHGQADQLRIASPARQREFLDDFANNTEQRIAYEQAWRAYHAAVQRLERLRTQEADMIQRADYLRESIARINQADPQPGQLNELKAHRSRIENAAQIEHGVSMAMAALDGAPEEGVEGTINMLGHAAAALRNIHVGGVFDELANRLNSTVAELDDIRFTLAQQLPDEHDAADLDELNARIHELNELVQRWGPTLDDVIAWRDQAMLDLEDMDASPEKQAELEKQRDKALKHAMTAARALHDTRVNAAQALSVNVTKELDSLAMPGAELDVQVRERATLDANGLDDVEFLFRPFPDSPPLPMGKSASGGELSRLMLAMELTSASTHMQQHAKGEPAMTFIFDEVDAGVGGKAAMELGRRLAILARSAQVIVVTHLPQVAAWASKQFVVTKGDGPGGIETTVRQVEGNERLKEIARMLSGSSTKTSHAHAQELLAECVL
ncbi:DNA repair protein RecN [Bifidobacterium gallicum]|uniref:DNA repair protein RecN n=1 Tax=Bifidobacterium gallicum DSM 20093 = LMG 11596 TaxID=561180 RepID=D1NTW4_9BIFI|nr:DNA repair protein RecN [Bifidobacterium gallicum]EFA23168.1 DNA repair protein RecN [Bifidobacterium gallicum DSM 20093 = LMG 11596]KFI58837.1 DNA repair protein RecN [Bifidobacterium gallicum DSM 20093 = LMG 11596]